MIYIPSGPEVTVRSVERSTLFAVTVAPGITAPDGSLIVPEMVPVAACDHANWDKIATEAITANTHP